MSVTVFPAAIISSNSSGGVTVYPAARLSGAAPVVTILTPSIMTIASGQGQSSASPMTIVVLVTDQLGGPFAGTAVNAAVLAGNASLNLPSVQTDGSGLASFSVAPGGTASSIDVLVALAVDPTKAVTFHLTGVGQPQQLAVPTITLLDTDPDTFQITVPAGATGRYTVDGSTPTGASTAYTAPFTAPASAATIKAIAKQTGLIDSPIASFDYTPADLHLWIPAETI